MSTPVVCLCFALVMCISGCDTGEQKTDSMLRAEQATQEVSRLVERAEAMLVDEVTVDPEQHIDTLVMAMNLAIEAHNTFARRKIRQWQHAQLTDLERTLMSLQPRLAQHALDLLSITTEKTILLRQRIKELKDKPFSAKERDTSQMVGYLAAEYNQQLNDCCLADLERLNRFLSYHTKRYQAVVHITRNLNPTLEEIIRDPAAGLAMQHKLNALKQQFAHVAELKPDASLPPVAAN